MFIKDRENRNSKPKQS